MDKVIKRIDRCELCGNNSYGTIRDEHISPGASDSDIWDAVRIAKKRYCCRIMFDWDGQNFPDLEIFEW